jgi:hypothetical protein
MRARMKGSNLVIEVSMQTPKRSASGKTLLVATSRGTWESPVEVNGKPVRIIVNAFIAADDSPAHMQHGEEEGATGTRKAKSQKLGEERKAHR